MQLNFVKIAFSFGVSAALACGTGPLAKAAPAPHSAVFAYDFYAHCNPDTGASATECAAEAPLSFQNAAVPLAGYPQYPGFYDGRWQTTMVQKGVTFTLLAYIVQHVATEDPGNPVDFIDIVVGISNDHSHESLVKNLVGLKKSSDFRNLDDSVLGGATVHLSAHTLDPAFYLGAQGTTGMQSRRIVRLK